MSKELNSAFQASIEIDTEAAQERLEKILHPQAGPTLTPQSQTQPTHPDVRQTPTGTVVMQRKPRSDKGIPKGPKVPKGLLEVRFTIEPDSGFALHRWMVMEGYGDAAAELTKQLGKHYDDERLAMEK